MKLGKEWFFFSKGDRRAILLLALLLVGGLCALWWKEDYHGLSDEEVASSDSTVIGFREAIARKDREVEAPSVRQDSFSRSHRSHKQQRGLSEDFFRPTEKKVFPGRVEKFSTDTVLDLNMADTFLLKRVPGIGSWRARRIVEFRGHLGGYSRVGQLMEIDGMPDSILRWFAIHTPVHKKIDLNRATADEMAAHPYITYKQARVILRHKRLHGPLQSLSQLSLYDEFTQEQLDRLKPYVAF